jgi:glycerol uptake facilitator-like aquaporin
MQSDALEEARTAVERAAEHGRDDEAMRTVGSAQRAAVLRMAALRRRSRFGRFVYDNGLALVAFAMFVVAFGGQVVTGHATYNESQRAHHEPTIGLAAYLSTGAFVEATAENWESEFLQMGVFVVLTTRLYQRGSSESKSIEEPDAVDQRPEEARGDRSAPWPVRRGGVWLALYRHSLSIALFALFALAFAGHALGGAAAYNAEQRQHGGAVVSTLGYLATSQFWYESFQNWQSEFLSVAALVLLTIWLREEGSPQSKPVAAPAGDTGE